MNDRILRWPEVRARTGLSRTSIWRLTKAGNFPASVALTAFNVGWRESEVDAWIASLITKVAA